MQNPYSLAFLSKKKNKSLTTKQKRTAMNFCDPNTFEFNDEENETINKHLTEITPQLIDINDNLATDRIQVPKQHD